MIITKIGNDFAVRLSADDVARLGLKEGDEVEVKRAEKTESPWRPEMSSEEWVERMRKFEGMLPADFKFNRDEANER